jgi:phosphoenolpyruvate synthase/pyruvate phosphate dikinase
MATRPALASSSASAANTAASRRGLHAPLKFCHRIGLTYVSCSPYRVPVARLAAAQAAIEEKRKAKKK